MDETAQLGIDDALEKRETREMTSDAPLCVFGFRLAA
jgi:hypothetical protein